MHCLVKFAVFWWWAYIFNIHRPEFLKTVAIMFYCRRVNVKEPIRFHVENPHGQRAKVKKIAVILFREFKLMQLFFKLMMEFFQPLLCQFVFRYIKACAYHFYRLTISIGFNTSPRL